MRTCEPSQWQVILAFRQYRWWYFIAPPKWILSCSFCFFFLFWRCSIFTQRQQRAIKFILCLFLVWDCRALWAAKPYKIAGGQNKEIRRNKSTAQEFRNWMISIIVSCVLRHKTSDAKKEVAPHIFRIPQQFRPRSLIYCHLWTESLWLVGPHVLLFHALFVYEYLIYDKPNRLTSSLGVCKLIKLNLSVAQRTYIWWMSILYSITPYRMSWRRFHSSSYVIFM